MLEGSSYPGTRRSGLGAASIIVSMALVAIGNGLMFAYIPVRLGAAGYAPAWAGWVLTGLSAGGIAGCFLTGGLVRRVGHARAFTIFCALIVLSNSLVAVAVDPVLWIGARALYGFAICGLFIVAQSWLNEAVENVVRGRTMAIFYVCYVLGLGIGGYLLKYLELASTIAPLVGIIFTAFSMLPVGATRLPVPPPPAAAAVAFRRAWRISPVGMAGMLAVGALSMLIGGFAPIHATAIGFSQAQVATLLFALPIGTLLFQLPLGWISDRTDRRYVLIAAAVIVTCAGALASSASTVPFAWLVLIYLIWSGASDSIYSLSSAHANDRAAEGDHVMLSSSMLFAWSVAGCVAPGLGSVLTEFYGTHAVIELAIGTSALFAGFVALRVFRATPATASSPLAPLTAQAPLPLAPAVDLGADSPAE